MNVMKTMTIISVMIIASCNSFGANSDLSDADEIRRHIKLSAGVIDNPQIARNELAYALSLCGSDTNRFVEEIKVVIEDVNASRKSRLLREVGVYGSAADLDFLTACATNEMCGASAVRAMLDISGLTSNVINTAMSVCSNRIVDCDEKVQICAAVWKKACAHGTSPDIADYGRNRILAYAATAGENVSWLDFYLRSIDHGYRYSNRRLAVLRAVNELHIDVDQRNFVTNAINELVAYPESALKD